MIKDVVLPEIAENISSGEVLVVLVAEGDSIKQEQSLIEVETEKAAMEIPSPFAGKIISINVKVGDTIKVGASFCKIETDANDAETSSNKQEKKDLPDPEQNIQEEKTIEPQKENPETEEKKPTEKQPPSEHKFEPKSPDYIGAIIPASPSVRRFAREIGLDLAGKNGSGPAGRISIDDVKKMAKHILSGISSSTAAAGVPELVLPDFSRWGKTTTKAMSKVREITAKGLSASWRNVPQVTQFHEANLSLIETFIKNHSAHVEKANGKLTVTAIFVKLTALALKKYPQFNASIDFEKKEIIYKDFINIGIAVDTDRGLLVPVIRDAAKKSITDISVEIQDLAAKTREKKIKPDQLDGGTFTISNLGGIGGTQFSPIVYWPQVAIIGISRSRIVPVYENDTFRPQTMLPVSLSYDHRIIDGADGIRFLDWIVKMIEYPITALLTGGSDE